MKKWLSILLLLGFMAPTLVYADDEERAASGSRIGLSIGYDGHSNTVSLVYDMGSGLELGLGLGLYRHVHTNGDGNSDDPELTITVIPGIKYALGKSLLDYGLGIDLAITSEENRTIITGFPNFYVGVELVKNLSLNLHAGIDIQRVSHENDASDFSIGFGTKGAITFYFL